MKTCRGSLRCGHSGHCIHEVKEVLPVAARALGLTIQPWEIRLRMISIELLLRHLQILGRSTSARRILRGQDSEGS